jgi:hypothetical protein
MRDREKYNAYHKEYQIKRYHKRMEEARQKLGGRCVNCGCEDDLEIDHIDWRTKSIPLNKLWSIAKARFDKELEKCQLLCDPCHNDKSRFDISEIRKCQGR